MKSICLLLFITLFSPFSYGCFGQLASSISQGISQKYEMEKERTNQLMKLASERVKVAKDCREQLQEAMIKYRSEKIKLERTIAKQPVDIDAAEIEYQEAVLKLKAECEDKANEEFVTYKQQQYSVPIGDPTAIAAFETTVNKGWITIYTNCWSGVNQGGRQNARQEQVKLLARKLKNAIEDIREQVNFAKEQLKELHAQTVMVQNTMQTNCREANDLQDYNERVIADIHAKGMAAASQMQSINMLGSVMSCMSGGNNGTTNGNSNPSAL